jgi:hypothetical protein
MHLPPPSFRQDSLPTKAAKSRYPLKNSLKDHRFPDAMARETPFIFAVAGCENPQYNMCAVLPVAAKHSFSPAGPGFLRRQHLWA